eukprot:CAMPEP_0115865764 /NCGR_PEP_ID=MMETSP0287-20121206/19892_1 /TAXON_ID=412157 /ORGANISM="Chrysochromulina rotalis, Strain UIO044" /LENGTH=228 /DNA_ID=CAMNT_0003320291 /DNA_START=40 /DNA_END=726 /DNA_ORIENTATION=+
MTVSPPDTKARVRRSTRLLQLCSGAMLTIGGVCLVVNSDGWVLTMAGIFLLLGGATGLLGLWFTWHRGLVLFTLMSWTLVLMAGILIMQLVLDHNQDPVKWTVWLLIALASLPAATLSSTMHLLRVWRGPRPPTEDQQRAPLVDEAADWGPGPGAGQCTGQPPQPSPPARPIWPPPSDRPLGLGGDLLATGRVAAAAQSGDFSQVRATDVAAASRTAMKATSTWPPPK